MHRNLSLKCTAGSRAISMRTLNHTVNAMVHYGEVATSGKTISVKDNISTADMPTTCSSALLRDFHPPYDATVVSLLRSSGFYITGKTNCDEFGMGSLNVHSIHGPVVNPHQSSSCTKPWVERERRSAGGSSGGSAAAVAANLCSAALGTDTGGSIRLPASYCGVVGLKPSYGLVSRWGVVPYSDSLDCVGVLAKTVGGVREVFDVIAKYDHKDPSAVTPETRAKSREACQKSCSNIGKDLSGLRVGVPQEYFPSELSPSILDAARRVLASLQRRGATIVPVSLPSTSYALSAYYVIASAEASSNMAKYDGVQYGMRVDSLPGSDKTNTATVYARSRTVGFGQETKKRILLGTYALTANAFDNYFLQAQRVRALVREDFDRVFRAPNVLSSQPKAEEEGVDVLVHPSAIRTAPLLDDQRQADELSAYVQDVLTVPASLAGLPAMSIPAGLAEDGWPVGVSVVGQWGHDDIVMRVGAAIEKGHN